MTRHKIRLGAIAGAAAMASALASAIPAAATANDPPETVTPIQHLVVIFQENVSFDHYFGTLWGSRSRPVPLTWVRGVLGR